MRRAFLAGVTAIAPMLVGLVPFGLVAGATPVEYDLGGDAAVGLSTVVFAGASQLAAADVLGNGGSALLAALAAWTINLRLLLYSASIAPHLAHEPLRTRLGLAYLLTDQAYAVSIQRWSGVDADPPQRRVAYYLGAALCLWLTWQVTTVAGILVGPVVPDSVPLSFAVPLVFLVLLVPTVSTPPAAVAAVAGGASAVLAAEGGAAESSIIVGALVGIVAGCIAEAAGDRSAARRGRSLR